MDLNTRIKALGACLEAVTWAETQESVEGAWESCARGDWLLWFAARVGVDHHVVRLAACRCASRALRYVPEGEDRPRLAIEAAEAYARGESTSSQLAAACAAARDAAWDAACAAARDAESAVQAEIIRAAIPWALVREAIDRMDAAQCKLD